MWCQWKVLRDGAEWCLMVAVWCRLLAAPGGNSGPPQAYQRELDLFRQKHPELALHYIRFEPLSPLYLTTMATQSAALAKGVVTGYLRRVGNPTAMDVWLTQRIECSLRGQRVYPAAHVEALLQGDLYFCTYAFSAPFSKDELSMTHLGYGILAVRKGRPVTMAGL